MVLIFIFQGGDILIGKVLEDQHIVRVISGIVAVHRSGERMNGGRRKEEIVRFDDASQFGWKGAPWIS
jgi:hypothetical protein